MGGRRLPPLTAGVSRQPQSAACGAALTDSPTPVEGCEVFFFTPRSFFSPGPGAEAA